MVLKEVNMIYLITGSGYLATHLIRELLKSDEVEKIKVFSRAEKGQ
jgi:nucleoside-diphosphate-sugar epimerase